MIRSALQIFLSRGYFVNDREVAERGIMNGLKYLSINSKN